MELGISNIASYNNSSMIFLKLDILTFDFVLAAAVRRRCMGRWEISLAVLSTTI